jgi:hypothetical protein
LVPSKLLASLLAYSSQALYINMQANQADKDLLAWLLETAWLYQLHKGLSEVLEFIGFLTLLSDHMVLSIWWFAKYLTHPAANR